MAKVKYSQYQLDIFDWAVGGDGNSIINAVAGSGKTTTIVDAMGKVKGSVRFLAFNKHIASALELRAPMTASVSTINALGHQIVNQNLRRPFMDPFKVDKIIAKNMNYKDAMRCKGAVKQVVSLIKANYDGKDFPLSADIINSHGIMFPKRPDDIDWPKFCTEVFMESMSQSTVFDFDDQVLFPLFFDMEIKPTDWVMVDEAQDLNPVQAILVERAAAGGRLMAVGDPYQAIYAFRGADANSIENLMTRFKATPLPLSVCYRCPVAVLDEARKIVSHIENGPDVKPGLVQHMTETGWAPQPGDLVLCRTTAPLVSKCLQSIRSGVKATVKGRDIGEGLTKLAANAMLTGTNDQRTLEQYRALTMAKLAKAPEAVQVAVEDQINTLSAILDHAERSGKEWKTVVTELFSDSSTTGILFSTVHRAKGLEYPNVSIIRPDLIPHPRCDKPWQLRQEHNLHYVAITRSMETLNYVRE